MTIHFEDIKHYDALGLAELIRQRTITTEELLEAVIDQIEAVNPRINAVVVKLYDLARKHLTEGNLEGIFAGVPFLLKDATGMLDGTPLTVGCRVLKDNICDYDSTLVTRLKHAGLVILGKTSSPEFALLPTTESLLWGPTRNPWNLALSTGGSSGGAAAVVAAGLLPMAHASDGGGSIRVPASCCGVFGLKPTRGRLPVGPFYTDLNMSSMTEGVITRTVRDCAAFLDATNGYEAGDPILIPTPERPYLSEIGINPGNLKIAFSTRGLLGADVHPDCIQAVKETALLCSDLGHMVVEDFPILDSDSLMDAFKGGLSVSPAGRIKMLEVAFGKQFGENDIEPFTCELARMGAAYPATAIGAWQQQIGIAIRQVGYFLEENKIDLLLTPVTSRPSPELGYFDYCPKEPSRALQRVADYLQFTWLWNSAGAPAMSVPLFWNKVGLPIGVQFVAKPGEESLLIRLASQLEQAKPWRDHFPMVN